MVNWRLGIYCECLEKRLPKPSKRSIKAFPSDQIARFGKNDPKTTLHEEYEAVYQALIEFGLDKHEVELIMAYCVEGKPMKVVLKELGWISPNQVGYYVNKALQRLRDGGFTL